MKLMSFLGLFKPLIALASKVSFVICTCLSGINFDISVRQANLVVALGPGQAHVVLGVFFLACLEDRHEEIGL